MTQALTCPHERIMLTDAEGAGEHCHEGAMLTFHQHAFDWLDAVLGSYQPATYHATTGSVRR